MLGAHGRHIECEQAAALVNSIDDGVSLNFASWNHVTNLLLRIQALRYAA
jgi:hypothetical protein